MEWRSVKICAIQNPRAPVRKPQPRPKTSSFSSGAESLFERSTLEKPKRDADGVQREHGWPVARLF